MSKKLNAFQNKFANALVDKGIPQDIAVLIALRQNYKYKISDINEVLWAGFIWKESPEGQSFWWDFDLAFEAELEFHGIEGYIQF